MNIINKCEKFFQLTKKNHNRNLKFKQKIANFSSYFKFLIFKMREELHVVIEFVIVLTNLKLIFIICFKALNPHSPLSLPSSSRTYEI